MALAAALADMAERSAQAALSRVPVPETALRQLLSGMISGPPGSAGSFLADPLIEGTFPWVTADQTMAALTPDLLHAQTVAALDRPKGEPGLGRSQHPYRHQCEAWQAAQAGQSLIVATGTGSGKTECFLVPVLDALVRESDAGRGQRLSGLRALILYPLNALIASQRRRLAAWTRPFGERIRFCLYNRLTPEEVPAAKQREHPEEVLSRTGMRADPAPILVTNPTMLEYLMVRPKDRPILERSQGRLRWIIIDEAHTHIGTHAAELTLLLRRVMRAFTVTPEQVQIIATSATIGEDSEATRTALRDFVADLAGVAPERVTAITAQRRVTDWPAAPEAALPAPTADDVWAALAQRDAAWFQRWRPLADLRQTLRDQPIRLSQATDRLFEAGSGQDWAARSRALALIDAAAHTRDLSGDLLLPYRLHLMLRAQPGLWACIDAACPHRPAVEGWPFGKLFLTERSDCDCDCGLPVFPVKSCPACDGVFLHGQTDQDLRLSAAAEPVDDIDFFSLDDDDVDHDSETPDGADAPTGPRSPSRDSMTDLFVVAATVGQTEPVRRDGEHWCLADRPGPDTRAVHVSRTCPQCGGQNDKRPRSFRLGVDFLTNTLVPNLLDMVEPADKPHDKPAGGRRLLTFSDSRQGTARLSLRLQRDAERSFVRGLVYHAVQKASRASDPTAEDKIKALRADIARVESLRHMPQIAELIADKKAKIAALTAQAAPPLSWTDLHTCLARDPATPWLLDVWRGYDPTFTTYDHVARVLLFREFNRRPRRLNSMETLGLLGIVYDGLTPRTPAPFRECGGSDADWEDFLHLLLTFVVRNRLALSADDAVFPHSGAKGQRSAIVGPGRQPAQGQSAWPNYGGDWRRARLLRLLAHGLGLNPPLPRDRDMLDAMLLQAWDQINAVGVPGSEFLMLDQKRMAFRPLARGWLCPVTHKVLDRSFRGFSPYLPARLDLPPLPAQPIELPQLPDALVYGEADAIRDWLRADERVGALRRSGVWTNLHDRILARPSYVRHAEHTAQVDRRKLEQYEQAFEERWVNVLNCSTTMEMGIDIAGVTTIMMANVPPQPANYRQRVGRAGRRQDARAIAFTFCRDTPLGWQVFRQPDWAFRQPTVPPAVNLSSAIVAQRHVNALVMARFLAARVGDDLTRSSAAAFFLAEQKETLADALITWARGGMTDNDRTALSDDLRVLLRGTPLAAHGGRPILECADLLEAIQEDWRAERESLREDRDLAGIDSSAQRAIDHRLKAMDREFLLATLCTRGFLPGHGFPTRVVELGTDTAELAEQRRQRRAQERGSEKQDHPAMIADRPSRDMAVGLAEYAPGRPVVVDGKVLRSAGLKRTWRRPADAQEVGDIADLRSVWICGICGRHGTGRSRAQRCPCGNDNLRHQEYVQPDGFTVDWWSKPGSDIDEEPQVPFRDPWVSGSGAWIALPVMDFGRVRAGTGAVFTYSTGADPAGYALCLYCGRAETDPDNLTAGHQHLKTGRACDGAGHAFAIRQGMWLGYDIRTDVAELQLVRSSLEIDAASVDRDLEKVIATSLAVAFREAFVRMLGVEAAALGCSGQTGRRLEDGTPTIGIALWDKADGGSGLAIQLPETLPALVRPVLDLLENCPNQCADACSACLLTRDSQFKRSALDRHVAARALRPLVENFQLPAEERLFGPTTQPEMRPLPQALSGALARKPERLCLFLEDPAAIEDWPLAEQAEQARQLGLKPVILCDESLVKALDFPATLALDRRLQQWQARLCHPLVLGPLGSRVFALVQQRPQAPPLVWGRRSDDPSAPVVRAEIGGPGSAWLQGLQDIPLTDCLQPPPVPHAVLSIGNDLDGPLAAFGQRLWDRLLSKLAAARAILEAGAVSVSYRDRYLRNPIAAALLVSTVRWFGSRLTEVDIKTAPLSDAQGRRSSRTWATDWTDETLREEAIRAALEARPVTVRARMATTDARSLPHRRELRVRTDAGTLTVMLDQGFGAWRLSRSAPFDIEAATNRQAEALRTGLDGRSAGRPLHCTILDQTHGTMVVGVIDP